MLLTGYLGGYSATADELREPETDAARGLGRAAAEAGRPAIVQTMYWQEAPALALREAGVAVYREIGSALSSIVKIVERPSASPIPKLPAPEAAPADTGYFGARELLAAGGVPFPEARRAGTAAEAAAEADELGFPVVVKALGLVHKSDEGGVALGLVDAEAVAAAAGRMRAPDGFSVERMVSAETSAELIVGCRRDPRFGPVLLVGFGGILAELLQDVAVALAPAPAAQVEELLLGLRGAALLTGTRGRPSLAVDRAAEAAAAVSRVAAAHPALEALEVNPLLVTPTDAVGLDARAVYSQPR